MRSRTSRLRALPLLLLLLTGCREAATSSEAIRQVISAIESNDLNSLKDFTVYDAQKEFANKEGILRLRLAMGKDTLKDTASSLSQTQYVRDQQINHYRASIVRADNSMFADVETICWSENISGDVTISRGSIPVTYCFVSKIRLSDK